jgi:N-acetylglucosamine-6-phosphate deacetylase
LSDRARRLIAAGRLVLDDRVATGRVSIEDGLIAQVELIDEPGEGVQYLAPGFVDVHVHGWGGHGAMGDEAALDGMARGLLRRGVTSFLPTAVTSPLDGLVTFADRVRRWQPKAPHDGAEPLGFNLEGPFLARSRRGAHDATYLIDPADAPRASLDALLDGLRVVTIAPELPGATELIRWLAAEGVAVSLGHSAASLEQAQAGYAAGARSTTHLFNAMTGIDHREPGLALAALLDDSVFVELIVDGIHIHPSLWDMVRRLKPADHVVLVSDALPVAGTADGRGRLGSLEIEVAGLRATLAGTSTLAGSVIALDIAVRNLVESGFSLPRAIAAASTNPLRLLGVTDRGRIEVGRKADLVELDDDLAVTRVMRGGAWFEARP